MTRRLRACVEAWPEAYEGGYNPDCCRFPKSCSCTVYLDEEVTEADLEPKPEPAPLAEPWASMPAAESTSAALRRVEAELGSALSSLGLEQKRFGALAEAHHQLGQQLKQMSEFRAEAIEAVVEMRRQRDLARAELASAQQELARLRDLLQAGRNGER